jgi:hypothetical protein
VFRRVVHEQRDCSRFPITPRHAVFETLLRALVRTPCRHHYDVAHVRRENVAMTTAARKSDPSSPRSAAEEMFHYPQNWQHKSIDEQVSAFLSGKLSPEFRSLDASYIEAIAQRSSDPHAEASAGWIVHPKPSRILGSGVGEREWPVHNRALRFLLRILDRREGGFFDLTDGAVGPDRCRLAPATAHAFEALEAECPGDFLVYRGQTGNLRRLSVNEARASFGPREFGLDAFSVGCFLLTHPERLAGRALGIDSAGSEYCDAANAFTLAPYWLSYDMADGLGFAVYDTREPPKLTGSASGFLP